MEIDLSIIIPAYKERDKIHKDVKAADAFLKKRRLNGEIIVVDDGSPDDTAAAARSLQDAYPHLRVLSYTPNRGKGFATRQGIAKSSGRNVMFADAGLCVPFDIALIGIHMLDLDMCDLAHGSRRMRGSVRRAQPLYRRIGSRVYGLIVRILMGVPAYISDTQCGFKVYRGTVARDLFSETFTNGFMFDVELIKRAIARKYRILEFPVLWSNDPDTRYDPVKGTLRNFRELAAIRVGLLFKKQPLPGLTAGLEHYEYT